MTPGTVLESDSGIAATTSLITSASARDRRSDASALNLEELLEQAYKNGYNAAQTDAALESERRRAAAFESLARALTEGAQQALAAREAIVNEAHRDTVELAIAIARSILAGELQLGEEATRSAVSSAIRLAPSGDNFIIRVPVGTSLDKPELMALTNGATIAIREDPWIRNGDCVVEVGGCRIERQIESTLSRVQSELERVLRERTGEIEEL
jgi:flagellar assembly protein FliH